jgi:hypothetical protein
MEKPIRYSFFIIIALASFFVATPLFARFPPIVGHKFEDVNGNGVWDKETEAPIPGWTIHARNLSTGVEFTAVTDETGAYAFEININSYVVFEDKRPGWIQTYPPDPGTYTFLDDGTGLGWPKTADFGNRTECAPPPPEMTAWWPFDETVVQGPFAQDVAGTIDSIGTWANNPTVVPGVVGNALSFDGTQEVTVASGPDTQLETGDLTIDAWVRTKPVSISPPNTIRAAGIAPSFDDIRSIVDKRADKAAPIGYAFFIVNGRLGFQLADRPLSNACSSNNTQSACTNFIAPSTATVVNDNMWHHVAVTVDRDQSSGGILYVDGKVVLTFDPTIRPQSVNNTAAFLIGHHAFDDSHWVGDIDEVELFHRALTAGEVQSIASARAFGKCKGFGTPSLIQSNFGVQGNFEVVVPAAGGGIAHYWRDNDDPNQTWHLATVFAQSEGIVSAVSMVQNRSDHNFEVIARVGDRLEYFYRDNSDPLQTWHGPHSIANGIAGSPALIQSDYYTNGNFEVVTPLASGGMRHYWRDNDNPNHPWHAGPVFGTSVGIVDDVSMIQSKPAFGPPGDFEVVARIGDKLAHFFRNNSDPLQTWHGPDTFATGVSGAAALIQNRFYAPPGNFEVAAPLANGGIGHWWRNNAIFLPSWSFTTTFGTAAVQSVTMIGSNYADNFEVVAQRGNRLEHFWRDSSALNWHGPTHVAP